jgi:hypothetical protein
VTVAPGMTVARLLVRLLADGAHRFLLR